MQNGGLDPGFNLYPAKRGEVLDIVQVIDDPCCGEVAEEWFSIQNRAGPTSGIVEADPWHSHGAKVGQFSLGLVCVLLIGYIRTGIWGRVPATFHTLLLTKLSRIAKAVHPDEIPVSSILVLVLRTMFQGRMKRSWRMEIVPDQSR